MIKNRPDSRKVGFESLGTLGLLFEIVSDWTDQRDARASRWWAPDGRFLAKSGWNDDTPYTSLEPGLERNWLGLIVASFICKVWGETSHDQGYWIPLKSR